MNWLQKLADPETAAIDFDGVLHEYQEWDGPVPKNKPVEGALDFINKVIDMGYEVVIHSARASTKRGREGIRRWLKEYNFPKIKVTHKKPHAEVYVDDRAYRFEGDFKRTLKFLRSKKSVTPWNR